MTEYSPTPPTTPPQSAEAADCDQKSPQDSMPKPYPQAELARLSSDSRVAPGLSPPPRPDSQAVGVEQTSNEPSHGQRHADGGDAADLPSPGTREPTEPAHDGRTESDTKISHAVDGLATMQQSDDAAQTSGPFALRNRTEIPIPLANHSEPVVAESASMSREASSRSRGLESDVEEKIALSKADESSAKEQPSIRIPKIPPIGSDFHPPPNLAQLAKMLEGNLVDGFGNILDRSGQVLGRAEGDLPSMIGRPVSSTGEILSRDGEVAGYVAENNAIPRPPPPPAPLEGFMGGGYKIDHMGNVTDRSGNVIGHFNAAPLPQSIESRENQSSAGSYPAQNTNTNPEARTCTCGHSQSSNVSDVYLDVKSTNDGIQLIIKIPTVFKDGGQPSVRIERS